MAVLADVGSHLGFAGCAAGNAPAFVIFPEFEAIAKCHLGIEGCLAPTQLLSEREVLARRWEYRHPAWGLHF